MFYWLPSFLRLLAGMRPRHSILSGRSSSWCVLSAVVTWRLINGFAITLMALTAVARADSSVTLAWDADPDQELAGYRVYSGTASGVYTQEEDVGNATTATVANLIAGATYFFAVTAYDIFGLESPPSNEVSAETPILTLSGISSGMSFNSGVPITINAVASAAGGIISSVNFYSGSNLIGTPGATSNAVVWNGAPIGTDVITAVASDANGDTTSTQISVTVVPFGVTAMQFLPDGSFQIAVTGAVGKINTVYYSTDLQTWTLLSTAVNATGTLQVDDPGANGSTQRFYKVSSN